MKKKNNRKVAAVQMASSPNISANLLEAEKLVGEAVEKGARLIVLPENFALIGKKDRDQLAIREQEGTGPLQNFLSQLAKRHKIWLAGGTVPLYANNADKLRAACLVYDDRGRQVARYDKIHLFDVHLTQNDEHYKESAFIEPGNEVVVIESPFGTLGLAVCYDLRFPELFRKLMQKGAEILLLPAAFTAITGQAHWKPLLRARAIENQCYLVAAAQGGYHKSGRETHGHSMIISPWGQPMAELQNGAGVIAKELDLEYQKSLRSNFPALDHCRISCV